MDHNITPVQALCTRFVLPFEFYNYQVSVVDDLAPRPKSGHYLAVGTGKTATSTGCALYKFTMGHAQKAIVLIPPILALTWYRWLTSITDKNTGEKLRVLLYRGNPKKRKAMKLGCYDFVIMTYQIFKKDYDRIVTTFDHATTITICDEATAIKNIGSATYKAVRDFSMDGHLMLLTGTPLNKPVDAYAYVKLIAPEIYRNYNQFYNLHVEKEDFFGKPMKYVNLDMLHANMTVNARRLLKEDVLTDLPPITYTPIPYELSDEHYELYKQIAEDQILEYDDGSKKDFTNTSALWHALQQVVCNFGHFSDNPADLAAAYELLDTVMEELGDGKLICFTQYKLTSRGVSEYGKEKYGAVAVYGEVTRKQQEAAIEKFLDDPACRLIIVQVQSGGFGLNLQDVCADILFLEAPLMPIHFEQSCGRVYRNGQKLKVNIRIATAVNTIQEHLFEMLLHNDELVNQVVRNVGDLRRLIYGGQKSLP